MFAYCLNNPVCMADFNGMDAIYVVDFDPRSGLPIVGHSVLYIQDADGNWYMTEFSGKFGQKSKATVKLHAIEEGDIQILLEDKSRKAFYIVGDFSDSYDLAVEYKGTTYGGYNLLSNNCLHYTKELLQEGEPENSAYDLIFFDDTVIPVAFYRQLVRHQKRMSIREINQICIGEE